jgi:hypothetical protein
MGGALRPVLSTNAKPREAAGKRAGGRTRGHDNCEVLGRLVIWS